MLNQFEQHTKQEVKERDPLDALREWYHLVPEDLRRVEYEYLKYFRTRKLLLRHRKKNKESQGKPDLIPEYTKEQEEEDWSSFQESFLTQQDKKKRLLEIVETCKADLPKIKGRIEEELRNLGISKSLREPQAIILGGSSVVSPRDPGKDPTTDVDIYVIMNDASFATGNLRDAQIIDLEHGSTPLKYQITFLSETSKNMPSFMPIHILAQPHVVIESKYAANTISDVKRKIVEETIHSIPSLETKLKSLQEILETSRQKTLIE